MGHFVTLASISQFKQSTYLYVPPCMRDSSHGFFTRIVTRGQVITYRLWGEKGGGGAEGGVKVDHMVSRWDRKGISRRRQSINRGWGRVRVYRKLTLN